MVRSVLTYFPHGCAAPNWQLSCNDFARFDSAIVSGGRFSDPIVIVCSLVI